MRALVLTMLDVRQEPNQRIHYIIRMLAETADETVVATKVRALGRSLGALLRDALAFRVSTALEGKVTILAIHPPLNYAHAMAAGLVQGELTRRPGRLRRGAASGLSLLGMARDLILIPAFLVVILLRTRGTFDVCLAQGPWEGAVGWLLRGLGRVRRLVYDDIDFVAGGQSTWLRRAYVAWLERALIRRADVAISTGWLLGSYRRRTTGRDVRIIPNGVDPDRFASARAKRPHPPTLVYMGNVAYFAGIDLAIRALPKIRAALPGARLLIVGGGDEPYVKGLRELVAAERLADAVEFRGPVPYAALPEILAESDLGLATFRPTPFGAFAFPLKVVEYMAAGLPVIGTVGSETAELLRRYPCGKAVRFDQGSLAEAVIEILGNHEEYGRSVAMATNAVQEFTWARAMEAERAAIVAALGRAPQSGRAGRDAQGAKRA